LKVRATKEEGSTTPMDQMMEKMNSLIQMWAEKSPTPPRERNNGERNNGERRRDYKCYSCGKPGHIARNCFANKENQSQRKEEEKPQGN
jgi:hypothetical protein